MKTPLFSPLATNIALVQDLDDGTLRRGHALLAEYRVHEFAAWLDPQLDQLDTQFASFVTPESRRRWLAR